MLNQKFIIIILIKITVIIIIFVIITVNNEVIPQVKINDSFELLKTELFEEQ